MNIIDLLKSNDNDCQVISDSGHTQLYFSAGEWHVASKTRKRYLYSGTDEVKAVACFVKNEKDEE